MLHCEHDRRTKLEHLVEELAKQHRSLETKVESQYNTSQQHVTTNHNHQPSVNLSVLSNNQSERKKCSLDRRKLKVSEHVYNRPDLHVKFGETLDTDSESITNSEDFYDALEDDAEHNDNFHSPDEYEYESGNEFDTKLSKLSSTSSSALRSNSGTGGVEGDVIWQGAEGNKNNGILADKSNKLHPSLSSEAGLSGDVNLITTTTSSSVDNQNMDFSQNSINRKSTLKSGSVEGSSRRRRQKITPRPNQSVNLWSIMKNCIGKELSKIPMPVNFSEPLSMLQRITEEYEYAQVLHEAAKCTDSCEQLAYVAAFTASAYSTTAIRSSKPFNPLLGETFECDRMEDLGWRCFVEQVSHHPPAAAFHCESDSWKCWQEFTMSSKFRGKYLSIIPLGIAHLLFPASGNHYTWRKVCTTVHNIIVGSLWIDNHGDMDIVNHTTGDKCHLVYKAYSYFSRDNHRRVTGVITNKAGEAKYVLNGAWDDYLEGAAIISVTKNNKGNQIFETGSAKTLWKRKLPPSYTEKMYNFSLLAIELNEPEEGVAPTDSRLRPDQRMMENGDWDDANKEKVRLEEKQRAVRRRKEIEDQALIAQGKQPVPYQPAWFKQEIDDVTGNLIHRYTENYWECKKTQDWSRCPDIF